MAGLPFVTVRCPSCGSVNVEADKPKHYRCTHCESLFIHNPVKAFFRPQNWSRAPPPPPPVTSHAVPYHQPQVQVSTGGGTAAIIILIIVFTVLGSIGFAIYMVISSAVEQTTTRTQEVVQALNDPKVRKAQEDAAKAVAEARASAERAAATAKAAGNRASSAAEAARAKAQGGKAKTTPEPAKVDKGPIRVEAYQPLSGCSCKADFDGDGKTEKVQLAVKASIVGTWITSSGTSREVAYDFILRSGDEDPVRLPISTDTAPPERRRGENLKLGMGCESGRLYFAADSIASAYSLRSQKFVWKSELPAPFIKKGATAKSGPTIDCAVLPVKKGQVYVRAPGGTIKLSTEDGSEG